MKQRGSVPVHPSSFILFFVGVGGILGKWGVGRGPNHCAGCHPRIGRWFVAGELCPFASYPWTTAPVSCSTSRFCWSGVIPNATSRSTRGISRRHCCIAQVNNAVLIRDLGSTNGIKINGVRVHESRLNAGDEVTIGSHRYRVTADSATDLPVMPVAQQPLRQPVPPVPPVRPQHDRTLDEDALIEASEVPLPLDDSVPPETRHRD